MSLRLEAVVDGLPAAGVVLRVVAMPAQNSAR